MAVQKHIVITILILTTWNNLKSQKKRKFKAAEEVKSKRPDKNVDDSRPDMKGKIGCNACCLYWALHGVSHSLPQNNGIAQNILKLMLQTSRGLVLQWTLYSCVQESSIHNRKNSRNPGSPENTRCSALAGFECNCLIQTAFWLISTATASFNLKTCNFSRFFSSKFFQYEFICHFRNIVRLTWSETKHQHEENAKKKKDRVGKSGECSE